MHRIREMFDLIDRRNFGALAELYARDCRYLRPGFAAINGRAGLISFYERDRAILSGQHIVEHLVVDGNNVCAVGSFGGVLRSGAQIELEFSDFYHFQKDQIAQRKTFFYTPLA